MLKIRYITVYLIFLSFSFNVQGQSPIRETLFTDKYNIDPDDKGTLALSVDNISFFENNEFDGDIVKGYTLPGFRLTPRLVYHPSSIVKLELGANLLRFWGADKYPNYAYQNISTWKSDHYQWGFHLIPFFRVQIQPIPQINIILGNLYGGANHGLIEPLYNSELNYTADMETGAQFLYNSRIAHFDTWINWETFTFRGENYNEAFTIGGSTVLHITNPQSFFYVGIPAQILILHRGGEINGLRGKKTSMGNGAAGLRFGFNFDHNFFRGVNLDVMATGYEAQHSGGALDLFSYSGGGFYSRLNMQIWNLQLKMAYWHSQDYINLLGYPFFGNVSVALEGRTFPRMSFINPGLHFEQQFGEGYHLGAELECFYNPNLDQYENAELVKTSSSLNWSMGVFIRINPSIILKKL